MQLFHLISLTLLAGTGFSTKVHNVDVGPGLKFKPDIIKAAKGDTVHFHFYEGDHSVAQSAFGAPCKPSGPKAVYSGFINPSGSSQEANQMFSMKVNSTAPMWLYCSAPGHCEGGMAMVINPPPASSKKTLAKYKTAAEQSSSSSPAKVFGGVLVPNKGP